MGAVTRGFKGAFVHRHAYLINIFGNIEEGNIRMQYIIITVLIVVADQALKLLVVDKIGMLNQIPVIDGFFYIHVIPNDGIAMGMMANHQGIVIAVTALIMALLAVYIFIKRRTEKPLLLYTLSAVVAGGVGNIIDRIRLDYVVDYLDFRVWPYIFNFADICIVVGCFLLIFLVFMDARKEGGGDDVKEAGIKIAVEKIEDKEKR